MPSTPTTSLRTAISGTNPSTRVLGYAALLVAFGVALLMITPSVGAVPERAWTLPFFALVLAFGLAEATALHVEIRKESHSLSLACIPLMIGLLFSSPLIVLAAYVLGGGATLLWIRKSSIIKVIWNTSLFVAQVGLAGLIIRAALGENLPSNTLEWMVPLGAVIAAELLSLFAVPLVIMVVDAKFKPHLFANVGQSQILAVLGGTFAVTAVSASLASPYMALFALVPLIGVGVLLRSSGQQAQRFRDLQQLHTFTAALANERGQRTLDIGLAELVQIMRCRSAGLLVVGRVESSDSTLRILTDDSFGDHDPLPTADLLLGLLDGDALTEIDADDQRPDAVALLQRLDASKVIATPVLSEVDQVGVLFIADRLGMRSDFAAEELRLFASLANTLSARLSNDHLVERLEVQARNDALTGLPNRLSFEIALTSSLARSDLEGVVVMIDLDRFKEINDSLGHATGDRLLIEVANRLRASTRSTDLVSRFGGDEFAMLLVAQDRDGPGDLTRRVEELRQRLTARVELEGIAFEVGASFGVVQWPHQGDDSVSLLSRADSAMYEAKRNQLGVVWYTPEIDADAPRRLDLYLSVIAALDQGDFCVHFQPKIGVADGSIRGAEALVRWTHPAHGPISPLEFIPLVVQAGQIGKLTRFVFRRAAEAAALLRDAGHDMPIAVNLTPRDLLDAALVDDLASIIDDVGLDPRLLHVEITEDAMVVDFDAAIEVLDQLRQLGVQLAIDDFGTGYSSLQHLHRLPVDTLKIDRSFISRLNSDASACAIVRASINLATDLGLGTIGEGIEDVETLRTLKELGCDEMQGYLVSRPVAVSELLGFAESWDPAAFAASAGGVVVERPADELPMWSGSVPKVSPLDEGMLESRTTKV